MRALASLNHDVTVFEPETGWSIDNLLQEPEGRRSLAKFREVYQELRIETYPSDNDGDTWRERLRGFDVVVLHEWNPPSLAQLLLGLRDRLGYMLLFHDTHHRASSSPEQMRLFGLHAFDGVLAFGESLAKIYRDGYGLRRVWTLHEAADVTYFKPRPDYVKSRDVVWVGNWGEGERSREIQEYLLDPVAALGKEVQAKIYGVRYPEEGLSVLRTAGVDYGSYLPNLDAPAVYAQAKLTVHVPRQQYTGAIEGIPTIRVFEALASGIPLISAPWRDTESLFNPGAFWMVASGGDMLHAMETLLREPRRAEDQAARGLEQILLQHTCAHRAQQLTGIFEELLA